MENCEYLKSQARECRTAALRAESRPERQGLMQLARYYEAEAGRADGSGQRVSGAAAQSRLGGSRF
jgi:hypothetical protein